MDGPTQPARICDVIRCACCLERWRLITVLQSVMGLNNCCCQFGIGNPMVNDHLATCKAAQDVLK